MPRRPRLPRHAERRVERRRGRGPTATVAAFAVALAAGCQAPTSTEPFRVDAADYPRAFDAARETLIDFGFDLDRVDARAGVITTRAKRTSGLATPWDREQRTPGQEWRDFVNQHSRIARVTFVEEADPTPAPADGPSDTPADTAPAATPGTTPNPAAEQRLTARVDVTIYRTNIVGRKIETEAITGSTVWRDPLLDPGTPGAQVYTVPFREDRDLAIALSASMAEQFNAGRPAPDDPGER